MSDESASSTDLLLSQALAGSHECFGRLLHIYRNYLKFIVISQLERKLLSRMSASDVVQETFLEASRDFHQFRGKSSQEFWSWLKVILINNLHRVVEQHVLAKKRDVRREVSLEALTADLEESRIRLDAILPALIESPSSTVQHEEFKYQLANKLAELPPDYRQVICLRHMDGLPFEEIGLRMERSTGAARMLWLRAIRALRASIDF